MRGADTQVRHMVWAQGDHILGWRGHTTGVLPPRHAQRGVRGEPGRETSTVTCHEVAAASCCGLVVARRRPAATHVVCSVVRGGAMVVCGAARGCTRLDRQAASAGI